MVPRKKPEASDLPIVGQTVAAPDYLSSVLFPGLAEGGGPACGMYASLQLGLSLLLPRPKVTSGSLERWPRKMPRRGTAFLKGEPAFGPDVTDGSQWVATLRCGSLEPE